MSFATVAALSLLLAVARAPQEAPEIDKTPQKPIPSAAVTLRAIDRILSDPQVDVVRPEYPLIADFADRSDRVMVVIGEPFFAFSGQKHLDATLLAYYLAGAVKFDLAHPDLAQDARADQAAAIRAALLFYRKHRAAHPKALHSLFERFDELDRTGELDSFVRKAELPPASPR